MKAYAGTLLYLGALKPTDRRHMVMYFCILADDYLLLMADTQKIISNEVVNLSFLRSSGYEGLKCSGQR